MQNFQVILENEKGNEKDFEKLQRLRVFSFFQTKLSKNI